MIGIVRTAAMFIASAFMGSYLTKVESTNTTVENQDSPGLPGWWSRQPFVVKAAAVVGVTASAVAVFNWAKHGNWKGSSASKVRR